MPVRTIDSVVTSLETNPFTSKAGKTFTEHLVVTQDGEKVSVGLKQKYRVGDRINVDVDQKFGKLQEVGPPTGVPTKAPAKSTVAAAPYSSRTFPVPELSGEMAIIRQNALTNARELVGYKSSIAVASNTPKAERDQIYDALVEDVLRIAYKFADFTSGHREMKVARQASRLSDSSVGEGA